LSAGEVVQAAIGSVAWFGSGIREPVALGPAGHGRRGR